MNSSPTSHTLASSQRLKKSSEFRTIRKQGKTIYSRNFLLVIGPPKDGESRLGVTVSKRVHKRAVRRNYLKRCFRESFRKLTGHLENPRDLIIIARKPAVNATYNELDKEIRGALQRGKLLQ